MPYLDDAGLMRIKFTGKPLYCGVGGGGLRRLIREQNERDETLMRKRLEHWVSGLEPEVVYNRTMDLVGLTYAVIPIGWSCPIVVRVEDVQ